MSPCLTITASLAIQKTTAERVKRLLSGRPIVARARGAKA
jgi:hypothetical protein